MVAAKALNSDVVEDGVAGGDTPDVHPKEVVEGNDNQQNGGGDNIKMERKYKVAAVSCGGAVLTSSIAAVLLFVVLGYVFAAVAAAAAAVFVPLLALTLVIGRRKAKAAEVERVAAEQQAAEEKAGQIKKDQEKGQDSTAEKSALSLAEAESSIYMNREAKASSEVKSEAPAKAVPKQDEVEKSKSEPAVEAFKEPKLYGYKTVTTTNRFPKKKHLNAVDVYIDGVYQGQLSLRGDNRQIFPGSGHCMTYTSKSREINVFCLEGREDAIIEFVFAYQKSGRAPRSDHVYKRVFRNGLAYQSEAYAKEGIAGANPDVPPYGDGGRPRSSHVVCAFDPECRKRMDELGTAVLQHMNKREKALFNKHRKIYDSLDKYGARDGCCAALRAKLRGPDFIDGIGRVRGSLTKCIGAREKMQREIIESELKAKDPNGSETTEKVKAELQHSERVLEWLVCSRYMMCGLIVALNHGEGWGSKPRFIKLNDDSEKIKGKCDGLKNPALSKVSETEYGQIMQEFRKHDRQYVEAQEGQMSDVPHVVSDVASAKVQRPAAEVTA